MRWQRIEVALRRPAHKGSFTPISLIESQRVPWPPDNRCWSSTTATRIPKRSRRFRSAMEKPGPLAFRQLLLVFRESGQANIDVASAAKCSSRLTNREDTLLTQARKRRPADIEVRFKQQVIGSVSQKPVRFACARIIVISRICRTTVVKRPDQPADS